jgi:hypothetical protein
MHHSPASSVELSLLLARQEVGYAEEQDRIELLRRLEFHHIAADGAQLRDRACRRKKLGKFLHRHDPPYIGKQFLRQGACAGPKIENRGIFGEVTPDQRRIDRQPPVTPIIRGETGIGELSPGTPKFVYFSFVKHCVFVKHCIFFLRNSWRSTWPGDICAIDQM